MRYGKFTSSEIWKLTTTDRKGNFPGAPALTYMKERVKQKRLKKGFTPSGSTATKWGLALEQLAIEKFAERSGLHVVSYSNPATDFQLSHLPNHGGTPDLTTFDGEIVGSVKCPYTENSFVDLWDICKTQSIQHFKETNPEYYWQLISDSIVVGAKYCVFIIFMPFEDEAAELLSDTELYFLTETPGIKKDTEFDELIYWQFEPPAEDIQFLTNCILEASKFIAPLLIASPIEGGILIESEPDLSLLKKI